MSLPYPHDRARARKEDGEQPFKDARETMTQHKAEIEADASDSGVPDLKGESDEERSNRLNSEAESILADVHTDLNESGDEDAT